MTDQQAQSPIDDLFRKTFENLPDSPAESGWDTPSGRVWEHVQANMPTPRKTWGLQVFAVVAGIGIIVAGIWFWTQQPNTPQVSPVMEQPSVAPTHPVEMDNNPPAAIPKPSNSTARPKMPNQTIPASGQPVQAKPDAAQPLPGSKTSLPPNSTEAQKKTGEND